MMAAFLNGERNRQLDILKGISIIGVVCTHTGGAELFPYPLSYFGAYGKYFVEMFLLISVYLMYKSFDQFYRHKQNDSYFKTSIRWLAKKLLSLLPIYYIALGISLFRGGMAYYLQDGVVTIKNIFVHIFLIHSLIPECANSIIGGEWFIGVLVVFYLLCPLLYKVIDSRGKAVLFVAIAIVAGYFGRDLLLRYPIGLGQNYQHYGSFVWLFSPIAHTVALSLGIVVYWFDGNRHDMYLAFAALAVGILIIFDWNSFFSTRLLSDYDIWALSMFFVLISQIIYRFEVFQKEKILAFIGTHTYGIYYFHMVLLQYRSLFKDINQGSILAIVNTGKMKLDYMISTALLVFICTIISVVLEKATRPINYLASKI